MFLGKPESLLPKVSCYFNDIYGHTLAIKEFNESKGRRKISAMQGLRYFIPGVAKEPWVDAMYFAHVFDQIVGTPPSSDWRGILQP